MLDQKFFAFSDAIVHGILKDRYGINNEEGQSEGVPRISFPISWRNPPEGTVSYAIILMDYDNAEDEGVPWIHWLAARISSEREGLDENESRTNPSLVQGRNSWALPYGPYAGTGEDAISHYGGPSPSKPHEYECTVYALDNLPAVAPGFFLNQLRNAMEGHVLAKSTLKMRYIPDERM